MKVKNIIGRLILLLIFISAAFLLVNVSLNYMLLFTKSAKIIKDGTLPANYYDFNIVYLLKVSAVDNIKMPMVLVTSSLFGTLLFWRIDKLLSRWFKPKSDVDGSSRWATTSEIKKMLYAIPQNNIEQSQKSGIILARDKTYLYVDTETINSLIIGTTRSGKGQTFVLPTIRIISQGRQRQSMVLNDPKGELVENSYGMLRKKGYKVVILNLRDTNFSSLWNPLAIIIREYKKAQHTTDNDVSKVAELTGELARVFTDNPKSDPIWPTSAKSLLSAMILYLLEKGFENHCLDKLNMYSVYNFFLEFGGRNELKEIGGAKIMVNALDELFQALPVGDPAKLAYATSNFATGDMRSSIFSTLASNLEIFSDTGIAKLTSGNEINFEDLVNPKKPCAIFMVVPDEKTNRHVLASLFVNQCYSQLVDIANSYPQQKLPRRIRFILDEFGNMVRIPSMDVKLTVCLGRNILFDLFVQDLNQLDAKYGEYAKTLRSNCGNLIYINSIDKDTNEYFSSVLGNATVEYETYSGNLDEYLNHQNINIKGRALKTADELSVLEFGEVITKRQRCHPIQAKFEPFYRLGIPLTPISRIMKGRKRNLEEWLFPFDTLVDRQQSELQPEQNREEIVLKKINELTEMKFAPCLKNHDFNTCMRYINDITMKKEMPDEDIVLLKNLITVLSAQ